MPRSSLFKKNEDTLPFFSWHPATIVGRALRIGLLVFMALIVLLNLMSKWGLTFMKYYELSYLIYIIPIGIIMALCIVGLFKRMNSFITKLLVCGVLGFTGISILITMASMMSVTASFAYSPVMALPLENGEQVMIMRSCIYPDDIPMVTVNEGQKDEYTTAEYTYHVNAYKYTAIPSDGKGTSEGAIYVPVDSKYNVEVEWISDTSCRYYLASDSYGIGYGEILVTFDDTQRCSAEEGMQFRTSAMNAAGTHTAHLYRAESYIEQKTTSIYMVNGDNFERVYSAYPVTLMYFLKTNVKVEGAINVEPFGSLTSFNIDREKYLNGIVEIVPGDSCVGATGKITIYLNEKASSSAEDGTNE